MSYTSFGLAATYTVAPLGLYGPVIINGIPLSGGKIFTYVAGTTTKQATYTDSTGATANTNPVILDTNGYANIWLLGQENYKFVISPSTDTDPPTNPYYTIDNIDAFSVPPYGYLIWPPAGSGPGAFTWVAPSGVTEAKIRMWGAGGAGGLGDGPIGGGGGGGSGGFVEGIFPISSGTTYTIITGAGGTYGTRNGGNTTFTGGGLSLFANGGTGGTDAIGAPSLNAGGAGGTAGQTGTTYTILSSTGASGADGLSCGGSLYLISTGAGGGAPCGGPGGAGIVGWGASASYLGPSIPGAFPGGGGSGSFLNGTITANGANGAVTVEYE